MLKCSPSPLYSGHVEVGDDARNVSSEHLIQIYLTVQP